ncbi:MAG: phosphopentomutase [Candidatus Muiribacteriota bacterium]
MMKAVLIILDSVGVGYMPDAEKYGDSGADTLGHIDEVAGLKLPNMVKLGLGNIKKFKNLPSVKMAEGNYGKMAEKSEGKDTITGHWEIAGLILEKPFPTYPNGFPQDIIEKFEHQTGYKVIGNFAASGTEILKDLGEEHVSTGNLIVYTSADSVFQIAAHEDVVNIDKLYEICEKAREILQGEHNVGRVIARPFKGENKNNFYRTPNRKDFPLLPEDNMLDYLKKNGFDVIAAGKTDDIFAHKGLTETLGHNNDNMHGLKNTVERIKKGFNGLLFLNLVDFDMKFGHRNDIKGYASALEEFDKFLPELINELSDDDIIMITADHGCDPTFKGTDHTREYVPLIVWGKKLKKNINLGTRESFSDIAGTMLDFFGIKSQFGKSFYEEIK